MPPKMPPSELLVMPSFDFLAKLEHQRLYWPRAVFHSFYELRHRAVQNFIKGRIWPVSRVLDIPDLRIFKNVINYGN